MSLNPYGRGPVITGGYPAQYSYPNAMSSGMAMQPGHNMHPTPNTLSYGPMPALDVHPSQWSTSGYSTPTYSRTPSPSIQDSPYTPIGIRGTPMSNDHQLLSIMANWSMDGPSYPESLNAYLENRGPMPNIDKLYSQMLQANASATSGQTSLPDPPIASAGMIISAWTPTPHFDVSQVPWTTADPKIHGPPQPAPQLPAQRADTFGYRNVASMGYAAYNGHWM